MCWRLPSASLVLDNNSGDEHPVHTHRHTFEVTKVKDQSMSGLMKDTISLSRFSTAEIDFIANDPGPTFFHCHTGSICRQNKMAQPRKDRPSSNPTRARKPKRPLSYWIAAGARRRRSMQPSLFRGTRWYHSHAMAMTDLNKSTYSGEFGFLIVEPAAGYPDSYDREVLLASHTWEGHWVSMQDIKKGPPPIAP